MAMSKEQNISVTIQMTSQISFVAYKMWVVKEGEESRRKRWFLAPE